ncbi:MAG: hypothetical protein AUG51_09115 [Acidobacteria bacterium 13_1_20CM_3_53_8]|nr:MAG: hypothetical protein AUG51_09115 [Acidobacteria bacterium 13_1_20CM_3_53_8]
MSIPETQDELEKAWVTAYSPETIERALESISDKPLQQRVMHLVMRLCFRGIYFPQMNKRAWMKLIAQNRRAIFNLAKESISKRRAGQKRMTKFHSDLHGASGD